MNYRTIIAFMGKKQLQKYKPSSGWELVGNGDADKGWTEDFMKQQGLKKNHDGFRANVISFEYDIVDLLIDSKWTCTSPGKFYYYNDSKKVMATVSKPKVEAKGVQLFFDFFDKVIEEYGIEDGKETKRPPRKMDIPRELK